jgi:hypothetical protein
VLVLLVRFQHLVFTFDLAVPQLLDDLDVPVRELLKRQAAVVVLIDGYEDFFPELDGLFFVEAVINEVVKYLIAVDYTVVVSV